MSNIEIKNNHDKIQNDNNESNNSQSFILPENSLSVEEMDNNLNRILANHLTSDNKNISTEEIININEDYNKIWNEENKEISNLNKNNNNNLILKCLKNINENNIEIIKNIIKNEKINFEFNEINKILILIGENEKIKEILLNIELKIKENEEKMKETELEKINKKKYKKELNFYLIFKEIIENEIKNLINEKKEINYSIFKENEKNFKLILYSNNQNELENIFNKINYKQEIIISDSLINVTETKNLINKAKIKFNKVGKHKIFLLGNEKSIKSFKTLWNLTSNYSKQIENTTKEKENIQKEISSIKKQFNIK